MNKERKEREFKYSRIIPSLNSTIYYSTQQSALLWSRSTYPQIPSLQSCEDANRSSSAQKSSKRQNRSYRTGVSLLHSFPLLLPCPPCPLSLDGLTDITAGCFSAAQRALKVPNRSNEGTLWLMELLDALEEVSVPGKGIRWAARRWEQEHAERADSADEIASRARRGRHERSSRISIH
jgi:hypothetical protein